ncbi:zinc finger BED domain-containing protein DAYSLEEPER isoform X2 [Diospyros lotus]|uniref:zinc finger BED domain-containing protein DAYSLEEPER isoform X2 n=1 Tax=Diospyros lotus TaxID=55363 RepID=UPI00225256B8|nr:zinc finger BED domain-containing protein DAYSLEEPER isoform X2 [Diospyros lotus]
MTILLCNIKLDLKVQSISIYFFFFSLPPSPLSLDRNLIASKKSQLCPTPFPVPHPNPKNQLVQLGFSGSSPIPLRLSPRNPRSIAVAEEWISAVRCCTTPYFGLADSDFSRLHFSSEMSTPIENNELANVETQPNKRRKKKSIVWEHFTIEHVGGGCRRASCKQCKQSFAYSTGSKVAGTSHLKRHIAKGTCHVVLRNQERNQLTPYSAPGKISGTVNGIDTPKRRYRTAGPPYFGFDPDLCRHEIARMIIMHDYPLHIVEHPGFIAFVQSLQPRFDMVSFNAVQGDCVATYLREKQGLQRLIEGIPGRICLTLDLWTSSHTLGYVFLTGHFIDIDWKLHRKTLNVVMEPYPESDAAFSHAVAACLSDWSMEGRLFTLTINQPLSEAAIDNLRALLSIKNPLMLNGQLLVGDCLARTLSSIAQEALRVAHDIVKKIRDSVKYVKTSESHEEQFLELKQQLQVPSTKTLVLDDQTRWNTTYEMLIAASDLKEVFSCLDTSDPDYKEAPSMEVWKQVETLCTFLKLLFDAASTLTAPTIPTTNRFFHEAWKLQLELARAVQGEDPFISNITKPMQEKFDKYWKDCCLVLAIAVIMDPRFKMKLVEFSFTKIYGNDAATYVKLVDDGIHELFLEYVALPLPLTPAYMAEASGGNPKPDDAQGGSGLINDELGLTDFDMYIMETTSQQSRSELDEYLQESLLPRVHEFDVLGWWKLNKTKYPTLSKMARDILTIPLCTLGPESVFDTVRKEMDSYRCSLRPETLEALVCAKDWLKDEPVDTSKALVKMEFPI